ncbi:MAG: hypothetical protein ACJASB_001181 [Shewanella psychromarinicola]|jgi:hypothetical protein|uniref:hypothetical protein n=1 Tax=Shewanella psychromarinicola TaxID=2487742 RepID=UPI003EE9DDAC
MRTNKQWTLMPLFGLGCVVILSMASSASAQPSLANEYSNRVSHSVGSQHNHYRQHNNHHRNRDPWRWGFGWDQGWGVNRHWGPSIGISLSHGNNWRYGSYWGNGYSRRNNNGFYPYQHQLTSGYQPQNIKLIDTIVASQQRTTTHIEYASGLSHLPANAKVIQRANGTVYEWQGVEYYFDWNTQTYEVAKAETP